MTLLADFLRSLFIHRETLILENLALRQQLAAYKRTSKRPRLRMFDRCAFSIFVFTDFIGLFRPALFLHPRMIHPLDP